MRHLIVEYSAVVEEKFSCGNEYIEFLNVYSLVD